MSLSPKAIFSFLLTVTYSFLLSCGSASKPNVDKNMTKANKSKTIIDYRVKYKSALAELGKDGWSSSQKKNVAGNCMEDLGKETKESFTPSEQRDWCECYAAYASRLNQYDSYIASEKEADKKWYSNGGFGTCMSYALRGGKRRGLWTERQFEELMSIADGAEAICYLPVFSKFVYADEFFQSLADDEIVELTAKIGEENTQFVSEVKVCFD